MAIEFNVKPSFGYYDKSEVKTVKKGNTITIIPRANKKIKNTIAGIIMLLIPIVVISIGFINGTISWSNFTTDSKELIFSLILNILTFIAGVYFINGDRIIEIDRKKLEIRTKSHPIPITKPRISKLIDFHGIGCRDKQRIVRYSSSEGGGSYSRTHSVKEIFLLTANGHIPVLFIEGLELGTKLAVEISETFKIGFEDDVILH